MKCLSVSLCTTFPPLVSSLSASCSQPSPRALLSHNDILSTVNAEPIDRCHSAVLTNVLQRCAVLQHCAHQCAHQQCLDRYYLKPKMDKLFTKDLWVGAAGQILFSLSPGMGTAVALSRYALLPVTLTVLLTVVLGCRLVHSHCCFSCALMLLSLLHVSQLPAAHSPRPLAVFSTAISLSLSPPQDLFSYSFSDSLSTLTVC